MQLLMYLSFTTIQVLKHTVSAPCGWTAGFAGIIPSFGLEATARHSNTGKCSRRKKSSTRQSAVHKVLNLFPKVTASPAGETAGGCLERHGIWIAFALTWWLVREGQAT